MIDASGVDTTTPGDYVVTYNISDASSNAAVQVTRTVRVQDTTAPVITLTGSAALTLECRVDTYNEEGATVIDACDTAVTIVVGGDTVDPTHVGTYVVTYDSTDASGNVAVQLTRTVTVVDTTPPVITLLGYNPEIIECPDPYQEEGATASDLCDGDLTAEIVIDSSEVNSTVPGTYEVSYTVVDAAGNSTTEIREVEVVDTTAPVVSLSGDANVVLLQGDTYVEEGATVTDSCDQSVAVVIGGDVVDSSVIGVYVVTYDSTDSSGNVAAQVLRTVTILPRFAALSALFGCVDLKAEQDSLVNGSVGSTQSVDLQSQSEVTGDVVNVTGKVDVKSKAIVGGNIDAGGQVSVHKDASVGSSVISGSKIDLKKNASIGGDATSGGQVKLASGANVTGVIAENAGVLPLTDIPLPVLALTTSGSNVSVKKNKSAVVIPGGYKKLSGKQASTISLSSGHYAFSEMDVDKNSVIELDVSAGPITVDVVGKVDFDGIEMRLIGGDVTDVLFQIQGDSVKLGTTNPDGNGGSGKSGSSKGAGKSGKIGSYVGTYLAPNAQLTLEDGGLLSGTAYAAKVHLKQDSVVNPEPALELLIAASTSWLGMESCVGTSGGSSGESGKSGKSENSGSSKGSGSSSETSGKSGKDSSGVETKETKAKGKKK